MADNKTTLDAAGDVFTIAFRDQSSVFYARNIITPLLGGVPTDLSFGRAVAASSLSVALSTEDRTVLSAVETAVEAVQAAVEGVIETEVTAVPDNAVSYAALAFSTGVHGTVATASARSALPAGSAVMISPSTDCFVRLGDSAVNASIGAGSLRIAGGVTITLAVGAATHIAYIRETADGTISVLALA